MVPDIIFRKSHVCNEIHHHFDTNTQGIRGVACRLPSRSLPDPGFEAFFYGGIWQSGQAGVDIFFVISGFIMWVTTHDRRTTPLQFLTNRIVRIVPLYWLLTLTVAAACLIAPSLFRGVVLAPEHVVKSLFFIPTSNPACRRTSGRSCCRGGR